VDIKENERYYNPKEMTCKIWVGTLTGLVEERCRSQSVTVIVVVVVEAGTFFTRRNTRMIFGNQKFDLCYSGSSSFMDDGTNNDNN
jgi:hypothetical protein